jgi:hypothetical protein
MPVRLELLSAFAASVGVPALAVQHVASFAGRAFEPLGKDGRFLFVHQVSSGGSSFRNRRSMLA